MSQACALSSPPGSFNERYGDISSVRLRGIPQPAIISSMTATSAKVHDQLFCFDCGRKSGQMSIGNTSLTTTVTRKEGQMTQSPERRGDIVCAAIAGTGADRTRVPSVTKSPHDFAFGTSAAFAETSTRAAFTLGQIQVVTNSCADSCR